MSFAEPRTDGPLAQAAGNDRNYIALYCASPPVEAPVAPPTYVLQACARAGGQIVDAAVVDSSAHMMNLLFGVVSGRDGSLARGGSLLDGCHWAHGYFCADGHWINVAALEANFHAELTQRIGLADDPNFAGQMDRSRLPVQRQALAVYAAPASALRAVPPLGRFTEEISPLARCSPADIEAHRDAGATHA